LKQNSIFVKLLGTFYQEKNSDFVNTIDKIYSTILLDRYKSSIVNRVANPKIGNDGFWRIGFIYWDDYNPVGRTIKIRDFGGKEIPSASDCMVSFSFTDKRHIYRVKDGALSHDGVAALSELSRGEIYPVMFTHNYSPKYFGLTAITRGTNIGTELGGQLLSVLSSLSSYYPDSIYHTKILGNMMAGAIWSNTDETVLYVSEDKVVTTKNKYSLTGINHGKAIVSVGQELRGGINLITELIQISRDPSLVVDIARIKQRLSLFGGNRSYEVFLNKLSRAISRKKIAIVIPSEILGELGKDFVGMIGLNLSDSITTEFIPVSSGQDSDEAIMNEDGAFVITEESLVTLSAIAKISIHIEEISPIEVSEQVYIGEESSDTVDGIDEGQLKMNPYIDEVDIDIVETPALKWNSESDGYGIEAHDWEGKKVDTNIVHTTEEMYSKISSGGVGDMFDEEDIITRASVILEESMNTIIESDSKTVSKIDLTEYILTEAHSQSIVKTTLVSGAENNTITGYTYDYDSISGTETEQKGFMHINNIDIEEILSINQIHATSVNFTGKTLLTGQPAMEFSVLTAEEANAIGSRVVDLATGEDTGYVISDNLIDA